MVYFILYIKVLIEVLRYTLLQSYFKMYPVRGIFFPILFFMASFLLPFLIYAYHFRLYISNTMYVEKYKYTDDSSVLIGFVLPFRLVFFHG